ncbi:MAG: hypothetical protein HZA19_01855 [Nitrospirae bacterium]|nr:hypothetical protein [Nitrospirota bacterium]MBI5197330.1 hypothetical protein [Nitrospirota bacterium]
MTETPLFRALRDLCLFLEEAGMDYMLVGGLAVGIWSQPRATVDVDFLVSLGPADFPDLKESLRKSDRFVFIHDSPFRFERLSMLRATLKKDTDISVDFLFADDDFKREALSRKRSVKVEDFRVWIPTPEDLILLKLLSGREQDRLDAKNVYEQQKGRLDLGYLKERLARLNLKFDLYYT